MAAKLLGSFAGARSTVSSALPSKATGNAARSTESSIPSSSEAKTSTVLIIASKSLIVTSPFISTLVIPSVNAVNASERAVKSPSF